MIHHKYAEYVELGVFGGLIIEEVVILLEELVECGIIVAFGDSKDELGGNGDDECFVREWISS